MTATVTQKLFVLRGLYNVMLFSTKKVHRGKLGNDEHLIRPFGAPSPQGEGLECVSKMPEAHFRRLRLHFCVAFPRLAIKSKSSPVDRPEVRGIGSVQPLEYPVVAVIDLPVFRIGPIAMIGPDELA